MPEPVPPLPYTGLALDRAAGRRTDPDWVAKTLVAPGTTVLPLWRDRCVVDAGGRPVTLSAATTAEPVLLGLRDGDAIFAVDLSGQDESRAVELAGGTATIDLRRVVGALSHSDAALLAYARGLLYWHRHQRYCGACGATTTSRHCGALRTCDGCDRELFPRLEPAVIVLVEAPAPNPAASSAATTAPGPARSPPSPASSRSVRASRTRYAAKSSKRPASPSAR